MTSKSIRLGAAEHREREEGEGRRGEAFERASFDFDVSPDDFRIRQHMRKCIGQIIDITTNIPCAKQNRKASATRMQ